MDKEKLEKSRLHGEYDLPTTQASPPEACVEWTWLTKEAAKEKVLNGESLFISGIGGTGKSYFMKELVTELQENGLHVMVIAKCHVATLNAGQGLAPNSAMTAQGFVHHYSLSLIHI